MNKLNRYALQTDHFEHLYVVLFSAAYSFLVGGVIAIILIIMRKNAVQRIKHLLTYFKLCFTTFAIHPYTEFQDKSDGAKFHFAIAIALGCLIYVFVKGINIR